MLQQETWEMTKEERQITECVAGCAEALGFDLQPLGALEGFCGRCCQCISHILLAVTVPDKPTAVSSQDYKETCGSAGSSQSWEQPSSSDG